MNIQSSIAQKSPSIGPKSILRDRANTQSKFSFISKDLNITMKKKTDNILFPFDLSQTQNNSLIPSRQFSKTPQPCFNGRSYQNYSFHRPTSSKNLQILEEKQSQKFFALSPKIGPTHPKIMNRMTKYAQNKSTFNNMLEPTRNLKAEKENEIEENSQFQPSIVSQKNDSINLSPAQISTNILKQFKQRHVANKIKLLKTIESPHKITQVKRRIITAEERRSMKMFESLSSSDEDSEDEYIEQESPI